jgi:hypothetical protein
MREGLYAHYTGTSIFSGYTPQKEISLFDNQLKNAVVTIETNNFTSVTFKHDNHDIEVSKINGELHIDNVTGKYS